MLGIELKCVLGIGLKCVFWVKLCRHHQTSVFVGDARQKLWALRHDHPLRVKQEAQAPPPRPDSRITTRLLWAEQKVHGLLVHFPHQETVKLDQAVSSPLPHSTESTPARLQIT